MPSIKTVCCVKVGDHYGPDYVTRLKSMVGRFHSDHRFVCFTDKQIDGVDCLPPPCDLPGWWSKVGLFRPDLEIDYPALYLDLDVLVVGDLTEFGDNDFEFATIRQWKTIKSARTVPAYNSSLMYFAESGIRSAVWDDLPLDAAERFRGDQDWLAYCYPSEETFPDAWFAAMEDCPDGPPTKDCRIVICNMIENASAARRFRWVRDIWW